MKNVPRRPSRRYLGVLHELHGGQQARARQHFDALTRDAQADAVRRMADDGYSDYAIAHATRLAVEQVREMLGERETQP